MHLASAGRPRGFRAGLDAAKGELWLRDGAGGDFGKPLYATQARWIRASATLLGLSPDQDEGLAARLAQTLRVPLAVHCVARRAALAATGLAGRGRAIGDVLDALPPAPRLWDRVLDAGHLVGLWGRPFSWDPLFGQRLPIGQGTPSMAPGRAPPAPSQ